jgi:hypothetical protein
MPLFTVAKIGPPGVCRSLREPMMVRVTTCKKDATTRFQGSGTLSAANKSSGGRWGDLLIPVQAQWPTGCLVLLNSTQHFHGCFQGRQAVVHLEARPHGAVHHDVTQSDGMERRTRSTSSRPTCHWVVLVAMLAPFVWRYNGIKYGESAD